MIIPRISSCSKRGMRDVQQDRFVHIDIGRYVVLGVADGNGGEGGGELAEAALKSALANLCLRLSRKSNFMCVGEEVEELGLNVINAATDDVILMKKINEKWSEAGTTITLVLISDYYVSVFWIGDSPAYLLSDGELKELTKSHTYYEQLLEKEENSKESLDAQPELKSVLTQCVGRTPCNPGSNTVECPKDIKVVVGSDGVFSYLSEQEMNEIIDQEVTNRCARNLVQKAIDNGSDDNLTAVALSICPKRHYNDYYFSFDQCTCD